MLSLAPPYRLRAMELADIPAVMAVDRASFPRPSPEQMFINELQDNHLAHYQVLVSEVDGGEAVIGFAGFWYLAGEIHISTIAVDPAYRGRGLGELLLLNLLLLACRLAPLLVTLEVRRTNTVAQDLYRKYRFEHVGERKRYYADTGEDALLMTVDLAEHPEYCGWLLSRAERLGIRATTDSVP